jgi:hypothetical protein
MICNGVCTPREGFQFNSGGTLVLEGKVALIRDECYKGDISNCFFSNQFNGHIFDVNLSSGEILKQCP